MEVRFGDFRLIRGDYRDHKPEFDSVVTDPPEPWPCPWPSHVVLGKFYVLSETPHSKCDLTINGKIVPVDWTSNEILRHPVQKPLGLMKWCVQQVPGTIYDPFMGTGTTALACLILGRKFVGIEIDPDVFHLACERLWHHYQKYTPLVNLFMTRGDMTKH